MLKSLIFSLGLFASSFASAASLPSEPGQRKVDLPTASTGRSLKINFSAVLPPTQKLNPAAPSYYAVYEKHGADWKESKRAKLANLVAFGDVIEVNDNVDFESPDSEIAIHTTLYHCGKDNKSACYIQGFQARTTRAADGTTNLKFVAKPTVDKY